MGVSVLIIEDNPLTSQDLSEILKENHFNVLGICYTAEDALIKVPHLVPDVILVDIQLAGQMTGIELVKNLSLEIPVVYLTANSDKETVEKVLETHPSSFLTKPFNEREVVVAIELAAMKFAEATMSRPQNSLPFIFIKSGRTFEKVNCSDVLYVQADGSYCKVFTDTKEYVLTGNLNTVSSQMKSDDFLRIHRSYLINVCKIDSLDRDYIRINGKDLSIGRTYKEDVKSKLVRFT